MFLCSLPFVVTLTPFLAIAKCFQVQIHSTTHDSVGILGTNFHYVIQVCISISSLRHSILQSADFEYHVTALLNEILPECRSCCELPMSWHPSHTSYLPPFFNSSVLASREFSLTQTGSLFRGENLHFLAFVLFTFVYFLSKRTQLCYMG